MPPPPRPPYHHRQLSLPALTLIPLVGLLTLTLAATNDQLPFGLLAAAIATLLTVAFGWLTVTVTDAHAALRFGLSPIRRTIPLARITAASTVRNRWWYGWGIRLTPRGWLWNASGLDAVELQYREGSAFRIGTDDPQGLLQALEARLTTPS